MAAPAAAGSGRGDTVWGGTGEPGVDAGVLGAGVGAAGVNGASLVGPGGLTGWDAVGSPDPEVPPPACAAPERLSLAAPAVAGGAGAPTGDVGAGVVVAAGTAAVWRQDASAGPSHTHATTTARTASTAAAV